MSARAWALALLALVGGCEEAAREPSESARPRSGELERDEPPPLDVDWTGGFTAGGDIATLRAECEAAGHDWNAMEAEDDVPLVHAWLAAGLIARCSGVPHPWSFGRVIQANFQLFEGRSVGMTLYLDGDIDDVRRILERIAPAPTRGPGGRVLFLVDPEAGDHEPITVGLSPAPSGVAGARFGLTYTTRAGMAAPPLPQSDAVAREYLARERAEGRSLPE